MEKPIKIKLDVKLLSEGVKVVKLEQDDYDDGLQEVVVELSDGTRVSQTWQWPGFSHDAFYKMSDLKIDAEAKFLIMRDIATQVKGPKLWFRKCQHEASGFEYGKYKPAATK